MTLIEIENVSYSYRDEDNQDHKALDELSLKVDKGEYLAILGHNGSGKSTLAKHLNALVSPQEGRVLIGGMDTKDEDRLWDIRKTCGMVFQNPDNQIVTTIVEDEIAFGPENLGLERSLIRERVDKALEAVDMADFIDKAPADLSGGQKQRIAIASVLAMKPDIIVFDEPTAMLDPRGRKEVLEVMKKLNDEGMTIINITHHMDEAVKADRVVVINDGKIILDDKTREVFSQVELLKDVGLDVPQATELAYLLKKDGFLIDGPVLEAEELVDLL